MIDYSKLPLSITSFSEFAANSMIYVDKTDLVANLARFRNPFFLSRPRRFGKSTLVSTFHELFLNGLDKFQGLKIVTDNLWNDKTYKVIHLDLSKIKEQSGDVTFNESFLQQLDDAFSHSGYEKILNEEIKTPARYLDIRFSQKDIDSLVLLIDEYDAPLTAVMGDKEEFELRRRVLSNFFSTIKAYSGKFRFIFITGVTRYSNTSIFSAFNNIEDISFNPTYGAIVGYTQEELEHYFKDYLENAVTELNEDLGEDKYTYNSLIEALKLNYDGYSFDRRCRHHVYNPWSILNFLKNPQEGFLPYWLTTGGAKPSLLVNYLNTFIDKKVKKTELVDYLNLEFIKRTNIAALSPTITSIEDENFPFFAILYQAGYFTIKKTEPDFLFVGLPNKEVKKAFAELVIEKLTNKDTIAVNDVYKDRIADALAHKDFTALKDEFNKILNEFSYESVVSFKEYAFRDVYKVMLQLLGYNTYTEYQTALCRSDLCFEDDRRLYICEFKVISRADNVQEKLAKAKEQIKEKRYGLRITDKEVITLAIVIVNENASDKQKPMREVAAIEIVK
ncbi:AAA family ATPase [Succinatimonas hippei]|uniref:AAA family ATPase n=3 Tax=Succinatimonas hippei TaxID=626938 RepID=UPI0025A3B3EB|nr:AAA family ATPase [Succinatimonas hippei]MDM8119528.1 AAA family ATPase [Succinatimonas hippei]